MKFTLTMDTGNAAFEIAGLDTSEAVNGDEIVAVLQKIVRALAVSPEVTMGESGACMDSNGNRVGSWSVG